LNPTISPHTLDFLRLLTANNNRDWFQAHRATYEDALVNMKDFADELMYRLSEHDVLEKMRIYRIYRDVRFSKDKTPYKKYWGGGIKRASALRRGSYFFSIQPDGKSEVGGGFFGPNKEDMKLIRTQIAQDPTALRRIVKGQKAIELFGGLSGEQVKTAPKGYKKDHPAIDLLRYKQFILRRSFSDEEVVSEAFLDQVVDTYVAILPFFDYMSEILTTDLDGRPLYA